jgi:hypothetical protein
VLTHRRQVIGFEEAFSRVPLFEPVDFERDHEPVLLSCQRRHASQRGQFAIDGRRCGLFL